MGSARRSRRGDSRQAAGRSVRPAAAEPGSDLVTLGLIEGR
ncbi:MAG TPA: hypothetical protein VEL03_10790 [Streptosporangiaceae bacterium]|nr:hypothetical protein [Streptosporangiaceae bacterium]